jgi:ankyrin repeat protein
MAFHAAAREGNLEELQKLIAAGQDLNAKDRHLRTALVMASWAGKVI